MPTRSGLLAYLLLLLPVFLQRPSLATPIALHQYQQYLVQRVTAHTTFLSKSPHVSISETPTHIHVHLTHASLNRTTTAQVSLLARPFGVRITTPSATVLTRRISLRHTFSHVSMRMRHGAIHLRFRKTIPDLPAAVQQCLHPKPHQPTEPQCMHQLATRVCLAENLRYAIGRLPCDRDCAVRVLDNCQSVDSLSEATAMITQFVFAAIAAAMVLTYVWGFLSAIVSIPAHTYGFIICFVDFVARTVQHALKSGDVEDDAV